MEKQTGKADSDTGGIHDDTQQSREEVRQLSECLTLLGCWAPFWTGTEKGELTRGSG